MKKIVRLTESDLTRIVRRVISEQSQTQTYKNTIDAYSWNPLDNGVDAVNFTLSNGKQYTYYCEGSNKGRISPREQRYFIPDKDLSVSPSEWRDVPAACPR
jgi:hypothetical protein